VGSGRDGALRADGRPIGNTYWALDGQLLAGEYPGAPTAAWARSRLDAFLDAGVRLFIDLTEPGEYGLLRYDDILARLAAHRSLDVLYSRHPITDAGIPRVRRDMRAILDTLDAARAAGTLAYVHCFGGIGRTGTAVGCLYRRHGATPDGALLELSRRWATMAKAPHWPGGSPETEMQRAYIRDWTEPTGEPDIASPATPR
jgi:hypothetical protein